MIALSDAVIDLTGDPLRWEVMVVLSCPLKTEILSDKTSLTKISSPSSPSKFLP